MSATKGMLAAGWVTVAGAMLMEFLGRDGWAMLNAACAHAWFIGACIVQGIEQGRVVINANSRAREWQAFDDETARDLVAMINAPVTSRAPEGEG